MHEVQQLLARLKKQQTLPAAMQTELSLSYDQFQSRWMERTGRKLAGRRNRYLTIAPEEPHLSHPTDFGCR